MAAFDVLSTTLKWGFTDRSLVTHARKISLSPNGLYTVVLYDTGHLIILNSIFGNVISAKQFPGTPDYSWEHRIMRSLLVNSVGNAVYSLVYGSSSQFFFQSDSNTYQPQADWAL